MQNGDAVPAECNADCGCFGSKLALARRDFLKLVSLAPMAFTHTAVMAGPFMSTESAQGDDKRLDPDWVRSLTARGRPTLYRGDDLNKIGMPIGGIGAGQLYLGGDGKLWKWDVFNIPHGTGDAGYAHPPMPDSVLDQGFLIRVDTRSGSTTRTLDRAGFSTIEFCGQYPIGTVTFSDPALPVSVSLEAFSPFIPLNADDSSLPATILNYTVKNNSSDAVDISVVGWLQNAVASFSSPPAGIRRNRISFENSLTFLECSAAPITGPAVSPRPERLIEDWHRSDYSGWTVEGTAFGAGPIKRSMVPDYQGDVGGDTERVVNSHATAPGSTVEQKDSATGSLTSTPILIDRNYIRAWIGGGARPGKTCLDLIVDGKVVRTVTGRDNNRMSLQTLDVRAWLGKSATIRIVDNESGPWGNIGVGRIVLSDVGTSSSKLEDLPDYGEFVLGLLGPPAEYTAADSKTNEFNASNHTAAERPLEQPLVGALGRKCKLKPGGSCKISFVIAWRFPNLSIDGLGKVGRHYAVRFRSASAVARYLAENFIRLCNQTRLWRDTWYDSTLPYWFLDRTLLTVSSLATSACYRFANGRFYAWEGVGCCAGTCTHVWHYAHAMARMFPELERDTRERVDFGIAYHPDTGVIGFRAEFDGSLAVDGQAGTLLRAYREHQMSPDREFLRRNWPRIKGAFQPLFRLDQQQQGMLEGPQMNTLDQPWFGKISWLSSLYVAALRAGEAMAYEMNEPDFARRCRTLAEKGSKNIDSQLFNGEYYIQKSVESARKAVGSYDGCEVDQVFGASWAGQVGLSGVLSKANVVSALKSLWKYSFLLDVGPYREAHKPGRWYAMAGEAGLIMCSWPHGDAARASGGYDFYLNECMTGFEYQAAGHMIREGLVTEGLAITRAIHDRYHASKRNPWNEVECGDHYSRAMAGFGVYLSALGYEYHGPEGRLAFFPRIGLPNFKAAFTAAEGWGVFTYKTGKSACSASVDIKYGRLRLSLLTIPIATAPTAVKVANLRVTLDGRTLAAGHRVSATGAGDAQTVSISFADSEAVVSAGQKLSIRIG